MCMRGWALAEQERAEEGIKELLQGLATMQSVESELGQMYHRMILAEAYGRGGQAKEGLLMLNQALAGVDQDTVRHYEAELHRLKGELSLQQALQRGDTRTISTETSMVAGAERGGTRHASPPRTEAEICFRHALNIARRQSAKSLELRAAMSLSRLWQQEGKSAEARQMLVEIYGWFTEGFDTRDLQEAKALLEALA
jgi:predicted ATPase